MFHYLLHITCKSRFWLLRWCRVDIALGHLRVVSESEKYLWSCDWRRKDCNWKWFLKINFKFNLFKLQIRSDRSRCNFRVFNLGLEFKYHAQGIIWLRHLFNLNTYLPYIHIKTKRKFKIHPPMINSYIKTNVNLKKLGAHHDEFQLIINGGQLGIQEVRINPYFTRHHGFILNG